MKNSKTTRRALFSSAIALVLCFSMLLGTTFAWFTDEVVSSGNKIISGTLDVDLYHTTDPTGTWTEITESKEAIFTYENWEPGYVDVHFLEVQNNGTLALKWKAALTSENPLSELAEVIDVYVKEFTDRTSAVKPSGRDLEEAGWTKLGTLKSFIETIETTTTGELTANTAEALGLAFKMQESAGNTYQDKKLGEFDICILATQMMSEFDSFDDKYDEDSKYPTFGRVVLPENRTESNDIQAGDITVEIPADAPAGEYKLTVENTSVVVDEDGNSVANFEIALTRDGQSVNSDGVDYTVTIFVAKGLNPDTIKLYHKDVDITSSIISVNPSDGTVTFKTDSFSPFAVEYKADCDIFVEQDQQTKIKTIYVFTADGFEQLNKMMDDKTAGKNAVVKLCANIDMTGKEWTPVDSHADTAFYLSEFDGQGFTISNLTIKGQAMFKRFAGFGDVTVKDVTFYNATVDSTSLNSSILTVQTYQNLLLDNVDVKQSSITGTYKVAPLVATVYNESPSTITCTVKNCDISDTVVTTTKYDFFTCGMISFVYTTDNDYVEYENCSITNVQLKSVGGGYDYHANIHYTSADTDDQINTHPGVTVTNVSFEKID